MYLHLINSSKAPSPPKAWNTHMHRKCLVGILDMSGSQKLTSHFVGLFVSYANRLGLVWERARVGWHGREA